MKIVGIKTHKILPGESIVNIITKYLLEFHNESILVITSKILSLSQNRIVPKETVSDKFQLIKKEADFYLEGDYSKNYGVCLTIKNKLLIPTAGIDESNSSGHYVLYPLNIQEEAVRVWQFLKVQYGYDKIGVLITDSHTTPLRRGVTGIALGWCGFKPLHNYIGTPDIFGNLLKCTQLNILDCLATAAVLVMGEGNEQMPLTLIQETEKVEFQDRPPTEEETKAVSIPIEEDLYAPLLTAVDWKSQGS